MNVAYRDDNTGGYNFGSNDYGEDVDFNDDDDADDFGDADYFSDDYE